MSLSIISSDIEVQYGRDSVLREYALLNLPSFTDNTSAYKVPILPQQSGRKLLTAYILPCMLLACMTDGSLKEKKETISHQIGRY